MAYFVIVCGGLLMLGGATSLLLGFDIVMTERGSAMTIGGIIALSGGVVSVGVGFALHRLSRLILTLERSTGKPTRASVIDRPVVPSPAHSDGREFHSQSRVSDGHGAANVLGGLAAAGAAGSSLGGYGSSEGAAHMLDVAQPQMANRIGQPPVFQDLVPPSDNDFLAPIEAETNSVVDGSGLTVDDLAYHAAPPTVDGPQEQEGGQEIVLPDLEEELARALAETDAPPIEPARHAEAAIPESVESFDSADGRDRGEDFVPEPDPERPIYEPGSVGMPEPIEGESLVEGREDDGSSFRLEPGRPSAVDDMDHDGNLFDSAIQQSVEPPPPSESAEVSSENSKPAVLGTYNVGGRTYRMFADGSVEAITETGIERFLSMDDLRKHLSGN